MEQDSDPLESQCTQDGVVGFAFLFLILVEGFGPERIANRFPRPLNETLAHERRTRIPPVYPGLFATTLQHRCHPGTLLDVPG